MPRKRIIRHLKYNNGRISGYSPVDKNVIKIDRLGEKYIVTSPFVKNSPLLRPSKIEFYPHESEIAAKVEKELQKIRLRGGKILITHRALGIIDGDDDGVWPPFISKKIKGSVKIIKISKIVK